MTYNSSLLNTENRLIAEFDERFARFGKDGSFKEHKAFLRSSLRAMVKAVMEEMPAEKEHNLDCISRQDGYGHLFRDCSQDCQTNGFNKARTAILKPLNDYLGEV